MPSRAVAARNVVRAADPAFAIDAVSTPTGLHYSWTWPIDATCKVHFVQLNLYPGHACGSQSSPDKEGTFPCTDGWTYAENSLDFLKSDLAAHASAPGTVVVTIQHYGYDGWSNVRRVLTSSSLVAIHLSPHTHILVAPQTWYNEDHRREMWATLSQYKTLAVLVGHTHGANAYSYNGSDMGAWNAGATTPGFIDVINAPATQKEDGHLNPLPSEFMVLDAAMLGGGKGTFRVAQRVGSAWGSVLAMKNFTC